MIKKLDKAKKDIYMNNNIENKLLALAFYNDVYSVTSIYHIDEEYFERQFTKYDNIVLKRNKKVDAKTYIYNFIDYIFMNTDIIDLDFILCDYQKNLEEIKEELSWVNKIDKMNLSYEEKADLIVWLDDYIYLIGDNINCIYDDEIVTKIISELIEKLLELMPNLFDGNRVTIEFLKEKFTKITLNILYDIINANNIYIEKIDSDNYKLLLSTLDEAELRIYLYCLPNLMSKEESDFFCHINISEITEKIKISEEECIEKLNSINFKILQCEQYMLKQEKIEQKKVRKLKKNKMSIFDK